MNDFSGEIIGGLVFFGVVWEGVSIINMKIFYVIKELERFILFLNEIERIE